jgi:hypothetical protein
LKVSSITNTNFERLDPHPPIIFCWVNPKFLRINSFLLVDSPCFCLVFNTYFPWLYPCFFRGFSHVLLGQIPSSCARMAARSRGAEAFPSRDALRSASYLPGGWEDRGPQGRRRRKAPRVHHDVGFVQHFTTKDWDFTHDLSIKTCQNSGIWPTRH